MKNKREDIPKRIEAELLFIHNHTCCICREKGKDVQIHHIDGNNQNNNIENLCVLCLDCHSKVTGRRGLGKTYTKFEVKRYKSNWELIVKRQRQILPNPMKITKKIEKNLLEYEIKKRIYELCSIKDMKKFNENIEFIQDINIFEDILDKTLDYYNMISVFIVDNNKAKKIMESISDLISIMDYSDSKINTKEKKQIIYAITIIGTMGTLSPILNENNSTFKSCINTLKWFWSLSNSHNISKASYIVINEIREMKQEALNSDMWKRKIKNDAIRLIDSFIKKEIKTYSKMKRKGKIIIQLKEILTIKKKG